jgi:hypothetical protein
MIFADFFRLIFPLIDEAKADSDYWSTFHGTGKKDAQH